MRRTITIPEAGETKKVKMTGRTLIVESAGVYAEPKDVPTVALNPTNAVYPLYPQSSFPVPEGEFQSVTITGTDESAGDTVTLMSTPNCGQFEFNQNLITSRKTLAGNTDNEVISGAVYSLTTLRLINSRDQLPGALYCRAEGADLIYKFNDGSLADIAPGDRNDVYTMRAPRLPGSGFIEVTSSASAGETFQVDIGSFSVDVTVTSGDTPAQIIDKINTALVNDATISSLYKFSQPATNLLIIETVNKTDEFNGSQVTLTMTVAEYQAKNITGGRNENPEIIEIAGIDFILKAQFINAISGETGRLIFTGRY